jgi:protein disulfide-isomerase
MLLAIFSTLFLSFLCPLAANEMFQWGTEEARVLHLARGENKPIVLAFIGADFCPWSQKMIDEVLGSSAFVNKMCPEAILWQCSLHADGNAKEDQMRHKYKIEECPTLLLLDPQGREFARFGYLPLDALSFAEQLIETIVDFKEICSALQEPAHKYDAKKWQELYGKTKQFSSTDFKKLVLERGVQEDTGTDLLLEKYIFLLEKNKLKDRAVRSCREKLTQKDPDNRFGTQFKIAMADFHKLSAKSTKHPQKILRPLLRYLQRFEDIDKENAWKAQMAIAHYLYSLHIKDSALEFAKKAEQNVPEATKGSIAEFISYIQSH